MRPGPPLAVLATLAALASGCPLDTGAGDGSASVYWTFSSRSLPLIGAFEDSATEVCAAAGVRRVRVVLTGPGGDALAPRVVDCVTPNDVPGAAFTDLAPGSWGYALEAYRGDALAYAATGTFAVAAGARTVVDVRAGPPAGRWDVEVTVAHGPCADGDRFDFDLLDGTGAIVYSTRDAAVNPAVAVPCDAPGPVRIPSVAPGLHAFSDWRHVDAAGTTVKAWGACRPSWTQPDDAVAPVAVSVTAADPPAPDNGGVCP